MSYYQRDKLSIKSNRVLANLLADGILLTQKVENFRQILSSVPYYDCIELFRTIDSDQKGFLTEKDFEALLGDSHKKLVTYVFSWFDQTKMGEISKLEFIAFLLPRRDTELKELVARRIEEGPNHHSDIDIVSTVTEQLRIFSEMLNQMIHHELKIIESRQKLLKSQDYSLKGVLNSIDVGQHEWISTSDVYKFLKNYAIEVHQDQIRAFLEVFNPKLESKISIEQLRWIVEGLENKNEEYMSRVKAANRQKRQLSRSRRREASQASQDKRRKGSSKKESKSSQPQQQQQFSQKKKSQSSHKKPKKFQQDKQERNKENDLPLKIHNPTPNKPQVNKQFQSIMSKFKQAEVEASQRDLQLIKAEQDMINRNRQAYYEESLSRSNKVLEEIKERNRNYYGPHAERIIQEKISEFPQHRGITPFQAYSTMNSRIDGAIERSGRSSLAKRSVEKSSVEKRLPLYVEPTVSAVEHSAKYTQLMNEAQERWKSIMAESSYPYERQNRTDSMRADRANLVNNSYSTYKSKMAQNPSSSSSYLAYKKERNFLEDEIHGDGRTRIDSYLHPKGSEYQSKQKSRNSGGNPYVSSFAQNYSSKNKGDYLNGNNNSPSQQRRAGQITDKKSDIPDQVRETFNDTSKYRTPLYNQQSLSTGGKQGMSTGERSIPQYGAVQRKL